MVFKRSLPAFMDHSKTYLLAYYIKSVIILPVSVRFATTQNWFQPPNDHH